MKPKFVSGPPGTGKTNYFIKDKYIELLEKYSPSRIIILSHTNVAAEEIRDVILNMPQVKEKGLTEESFEDCIGTIHSFCNGRLMQKDTFEDEDYLNCVEENSKFNRVKVYNFKKHPFFRFLSEAFGTGYEDLKEFWFSKNVEERKVYHPYDINSILELKKVYDNYKKRNNLRDFDDMIRDFIDLAKDPEDIDALIVDEAQDSNKPQLQALNKLATNVKNGDYYLVGDADQTIFEFAGSDADYFHTLSKEAVELEEGRRCGQTINNICKNIINPIWKHYGYSRKWTPAKYTERHLGQNKIEKGLAVGDTIMGRSYHLPNLDPSPHLKILLDKINNTNQTFLFTFRANFSGNRIREFLIGNAIEFSRFDHGPYVSKKELNCHYLWPKFVAGEPMSLDQIKAFWDYMGSVVIERGKSKAKKPFKDWIKKDYTIDYLIKKGLLRPESKQYNRFDKIVTKKESSRLLYINRIIQKGFDFDGDVRVKYGNFHQVKGLTFDNVIVDETLPRPEPYHVQLRLKYVAYSRGIFDCWTLATSNKRRLGTLHGSVQ